MLRDALGAWQARGRPGLAAVGRLVDAVADRDAVARPGLAGAHPDILVVARIYRDGADRLHRLLIEHRLEGGRAVGGLPYAAAGGADEQGHLARRIGEAGERGDAPAHGRRADVAGAEAGDDA